MGTDVYKTDVLIIGNGIAGLRAACSAGKVGASVVVVGMGEGASPGIMAFNAPVGPNDSAELYFEDTLSCGCLINDRDLVRVLVENIISEITYLERIGLKLDRNEKGDFDLMQALGASRARLVHYKALTGITSLDVLKKEAIKFDVAFHKPVMINRLICDEGHIIGAVGFNLSSGKFISYLAKSVVLAAGGCGSIYPVSQYPADIFGSGYSMAYLAGAKLVDMEFMQFDPCSFVYPEKLVGCSIPTTMLMEGAQLRNAKGEIFVKVLNERGARIHKDALSRAISKEIAEGRGTPNGGVFYDVSMLPAKKVIVDHSIFYEPALEAGVDLTREPAEVAPAAHSSLGGVKINERGETSLPGLYAAGETVGGLHGANRPGGSAGAEVLVFGARAGKYAAESAREKRLAPEGKAAVLIAREKKRYKERKLRSEGSMSLTEAMSVFYKIMADHLYIIKNGQGINKAIGKLKDLEESIPQITVKNIQQLSALHRFEHMLKSAQIVAAAALIRTESRGVHYRSDYPERKDKQWLNNIVIQRLGDKMQIEIADVKNN